MIHTIEVEDMKSYNTLARRQRLSAVSSAVETDPDFGRNLARPSYEENVRRNKRIPSSRVSTSSSNQGLLLVDDEVDGGAPGKNDPLLVKCHQPVRCALDTCSSTATSYDPDARPLSSRSNYENQRLCRSNDCLSSPRHKMAGVAIGNHLTPEQSVEYPADANNRATEVVNNLLKELGVYLPEDGSD